MLLNRNRKIIHVIVVFTIFAACFTWFQPIMKYRFLTELEGTSIETAQIYRPAPWYPLIQRG
jgi:hypothetical protein